MATPKRNTENFSKMEDDVTVCSMECCQESLAKLSLDETTESGILRSRINEQSELICLLKQRADELLLRYDALQKINTELESCMKDCITERDSERKRADQMEQRFQDLASNNQEIIEFMKEYKNENGLLKQENKELQTENETLFSKKLEDKEVLVQKLTQEIKDLTETFTNKDNGYREKLSECQFKLKEQETQHQTKEASLLVELKDVQKQQRDAVGLCKDLQMKLQKAAEEHALKETDMRESIGSLTREKDKLLQLCFERGTLIRKKQEEIQQLEEKWKNEKEARVKAEDRLQKEAEALNADVRVTSLQSALDEATAKYRQFKLHFDAYKEHTSSLLLQERELNKKLRHMTG